MIIVGELINSSRKSVAEAISGGDMEAIRKLARDQAEAGAHYIDANAGAFPGREVEYLKWLVGGIQEAVELPVCIDSPDPAAVEAALGVHKGPSAMINSISLEKERFDRMLPMVAGTDLRVIALCMSDEGMPQSVEERLGIADKLIQALTGKDIPLDNIFVDPLVQPVSTNDQFGVAFLDAVNEITTRFPGVHIMCGLSNVSYGLPARRLLNRIFMSMAIARGLDGAIVNPLDRGMMAAMAVAEALAGRDQYSMNLLAAYRAGKLEE